MSKKSKIHLTIHVTKQQYDLVSQKAKQQNVAMSNVLLHTALDAIAKGQITNFNDPRNDAYTHQLAFYISQSQSDALGKLAKQHNTSKSGLLRFLLTTNEPIKDDCDDVEFVQTYKMEASNPPNPAAPPPNYDAPQAFLAKSLFNQSFTAPIKGLQNRAYWECWKAASPYEVIDFINLSQFVYGKDWIVLTPDYVLGDSINPDDVRLTTECFMQVMDFFNTRIQRTTSF